MHACMHARTRAYIHAYIHTYVRNVRTYIHTPARGHLRGVRPHGERGRPRAGGEEAQEEAVAGVGDRPICYC